MSLRAALMLVCLLIFATSFGALLMAAWRHHGSKRVRGENFHSALWVEISWTLVPGVIVLALVWPMVKTVWLP